MQKFNPNDFDPAELQRYVDEVSAGNRFIRGRWQNVTLWAGKANKSKILWVQEFPNGITDIGIHFALDRFTDVGTPAALSWFAGLMDNASYTGESPSDTAASHTGWIENTDYTESVRQTLAFGAAAARTVSDSVSWSINATVTIQGLFVDSTNTKGGTAGVLFSTASFLTPTILNSGQTLTANYSLSD